MEKFKDLKNKVILISGATGLIGNNLIREFLKHEAEVYGIDIDNKKINFQLKILKKIFPNGKVSLLKCDITKENEVKKIIKYILKKSKKIDILVNNAASKTKNLKNFFNAFETYNFSDWKKIMDVNINGAFLLSREASKAMVRKKSGNIISIASIQGVVGNDKSIYKDSRFKGVQMSTPAVYSTSKSALIGLARYLATHLGEFNIRSNSISPGGIKGGQNKKFIQNYSKRVPLKRMAEVEEIVHCVIFLSSNKSSYISGQNIIVDGGYTSW